MSSSGEFQGRKPSVRRSRFAIEQDSQRVQLIRTNLHAIWAEEFAAKELERGNFSIAAAEDFAQNRNSGFRSSHAAARNESRNIA